MTIRPFLLCTLFYLYCPWYYYWHLVLCFSWFGFCFCEQAVGDTLFHFVIVVIITVDIILKCLLNSFPHCTTAEVNGSGLRRHLKTSPVHFCRIWTLKWFVKLRSSCRSMLSGLCNPMNQHEPHFFWFVLIPTDHHYNICMWAS